MFSMSHNFHTFITLKPFMNKACKIIISLFFIPFFVFAQTAKQKIDDVFIEYKTDKALKSATLGLCVLNAKTGSLIYDYNANLSLTPASTMKIVTTGAALSILGAGYKYETKLIVDGNYDSIKGIIDGDLIIKGSGDPTLNSEYFKKKEDTLDVVEKWSAVLKEKGIKKITGRIIADVSCFDDNLPTNWIWGDIGNYFGAGASGLSYNDNKFKIFFKSGTSAGDSTSIIECVPYVPNLKIKNTVFVGGKDDNAFIFGAPHQYERTISGTIPANQSRYEVEGALPDPAWLCAYKLREALVKNGVNISSKDIIVNYDTKKYEGKVLYIHKSVSLEKIIQHTNMKSNNHFAETLLKTIAYKKTGRGNTISGTEIISNYWKGRGVDTEGLFMNDGSGLSRSNAITPMQQATILSKIFKDSTAYKVFNNSLPVAGKSGSLASLCKGSFAENNLRAKSGYITRARGYAGYVKNKKGEELCFSILFNNYNCTPTEAKKKIERILELLVDL